MHLQPLHAGTTPLGSSLDRKVLQPMVLSQARSNSMQKPVLVICITDGEPTGEPKDTVRQVVMSAKQHLQNSPYGPGAVLKSEDLSVTGWQRCGSYAIPVGSGHRPSHWQHD